TPKRLFKIDACEATGEEFVWVYHCQGEGPFVLHPEEITTGGWFTPEEITAWIQRSPHEFASALPLIWQQYQSLGTQREDPLR
ncbi:MAG TPA: hypothetical protein VMZ27_07945, partial [Candidatus Saccharimonadales bacterium]|nr:hypothetical protein [Candidatus Saccharimonadales bacterium]